MRYLTLCRSLPIVAFACAGCGGGPVGSVESALAVCASGPVTAGVDVSHYDGTINWVSAHGAGIAFAFMKATESNDFVDPSFAANWQGAGQAGVIRGAYHFFRPEVDPVAQADYFVDHAGVPAAGDLPLTLDLEVTDSLTAAAVAQAARQFLARVATRTGRAPLVYTSASFFGTTLGTPAGFGGYPLWVANWQVKCPNLPSAPWSEWTFWQEADNGTVAGIAGAVDLDRFNGTLGQLQGFAGGDGSGDGGPPLAGDGGLTGLSDGGGLPGAEDAAAPRDAGGLGTGGLGPIQRPALRSGCSFGGDAAPSSGGLLLALLGVCLGRRRGRATHDV